MATARTSDLWWKNGVVYCLDVQTFLDWDGDGHGDFQGLTERVDYLAGIGVSCIWLMPFYPSPDKDDGYDITDYYTISPRLGSLGDVALFDRVVDLLATAEPQPRHGDALEFKLDGYGFQWFRLQRTGSRTVP